MKVKRLIGSVQIIFTVIGIALMTGVHVQVPFLGELGFTGNDLAGGVLLGLNIGYLILSLGKVNENQVGMEKFLGKPIRDLKKGHGLYYAPAGLFEVRKEAGTVFQDELPTNPEKIFREDGNVPEGMFPPIRVKFGPPDPADTTLVKDPYNVEMVAEVVPVVAWHIASATQFFTVVGTVDNCRKMLADKAVATFGDDLAKVTPAKASLTLKTTSQKMEDELVVETGTWGIEIDDAYIKPFIFSHGLNTAVEGVSIAGQAAKAVVLTAEGEQTKRIKEATGSAEATRLQAAAEKFRLVETGLARGDDKGNILELLPHADIRVAAEAIGKLAGVTGTVVLGTDVTPVVNVQQEGGK